MPQPTLTLLGALVALVLALLSAGRAGGDAPAAARRVGSVELHRCGGGYPGLCGHIERPLDPGLVGGPTIPIHLELVPARDPGPVRGTIVAVEGGPGYPSSGSFAEYTGTFRRVLAHDDLLMVDNRGTGGSARIRCRALDRFPVDAPAVGRRFDRIVGGCGARLDREYRTRSGRPIHAADLFATEYAVSDLHAVLERLRLRRVELYGDSYGSWFAQAFAARYPGQLDGLILDSTYAVHDLDPWYGSSGLVARAAMDRVCARSLACRTDAAGQGTPVSRLGRLLRRLRRGPVRATARTPDGRRTRIAITPRRLVDVVQDAGSDPWPWRELDAAVRASLHGDPVALARLAAQERANGGDASPGYFSDGDYMAVSCTDYPQLFSLSAPPAVRRRELARAIAREPERVFAPFTPAQWVTMSAYSETYDACLDWPAPVHRAPLLAPVGRRRLPASVPILIVGGDLDDLTPLRDARRFGPTLGDDVRVVDLHNTVHVTSEGDTYLGPGAACARAIIDRFAADPARLQTLDAGCAARVPPLQTPGAYPRRLADAQPAHVRAGPALSRRARRAVTVAAGALADAALEHAEFGSRRGAGLRGGTFVARGDELALHRVRFVADATVSGTGSFRTADGATRGRLVLRAAGLRIVVSLAWDARSQLAAARVGATRLALPTP